MCFAPYRVQNSLRSCLNYLFRILSKQYFATKIYNTDNKQDTILTKDIHIYFSTDLFVRLKIKHYLCIRNSGCSSARLEYASGGRVVAGSNPVTPTGRKH